MSTCMCVDSIPSEERNQTCDQELIHKSDINCDEQIKSYYDQLKASLASFELKRKCWRAVLLL
jgi:hypothetical protein